MLIFKPLPSLSITLWPSLPTSVYFIFCHIAFLDYNHDFFASGTRARPPSRFSASNSAVLVAYIAPKCFPGSIAPSRRRWTPSSNELKASTRDVPLSNVVQRRTQHCKLVAEVFLKLARPPPAAFLTKESSLLGQKPPFQM